MKKWIVRFFLFLSFSLISENTLMSLAQEQGQANYACTRKQLQQPSPKDNFSGKINTIQKDKSGQQQGEHIIEITENEVEENELLFGKKHLEITHYFSILFHEQLAEFFESSNRQVPFWKHFTYDSSFKWFLLLRVIRL
ncbi:hypothetical protein LVD15_03480 [Fulvivirga maritima]|uniref:hypothetical protein n=1 Tax=Fulvivirga maritima TaxID=2904247 RepID=UPI001F1F936B|nr:hypothetical protein [Fulvivirga maritima]UII27507.1 hypothetical protein LVD15_03480 [Fulvivirga maritima]